MALAKIRAATAAASIMIGATEYNTVLARASVRSTAPRLDETVFATQAQGDFSLGAEQLTITLEGPLTKGAVESVPFLPLSAFADKLFDIIHDTGNGIDGTCSFMDSGIEDQAGGLKRVVAQAVSKGPYTVTWDDGTV